MLNFKTEQQAQKYEQLYNVTMRLWPSGYAGYHISTSYGETWIHEYGSKGKPTLLLLHGMSGSSTMWYPNIEGLAQHFHIFAPDIIGQAGKSVSKIPLRSASDLDEWLDEVINLLGVEQIYLAGSSFGGWLATRYTIYQPHNIARLALLDPNGTLAPMTAEFLFRMYAMLLLPFPRIGESFTEWMGQGYQMNDAFLNQMESGIKDYVPIRGQKTILPNKIDDVELRKIDAPVLILVGERSVIYNPQRALERAKTVFRHGKALLVPGCGHSMNMEVPTEINKLLTDFYYS